MFVSLFGCKLDSESFDGDTCTGLVLAAKKVAGCQFLYEQKNLEVLVNMRFLFIFTKVYLHLYGLKI
jgi:hypothetical protein